MQSFFCFKELYIMFKNFGIYKPITLFEKNNPNTSNFLRKFVYDDLTKVTSVWFDVDYDKKEIEIYFYKNKKVVKEWTPITEVFFQEYVLSDNKKIFLYMTDSENNFNI